MGIKRFLILVVAMLSLAGVAGTVAPKADAGNLYCNMWNVGQTCVTGWNYWRDHTVHNGSTNGGVIYCYSQHTDGSNAGAHSYVYSGQWLDFWAGGYNRMVCQMMTGPGGFPIAIYSYT